MQIATIGLDIAKDLFHVHAVNSKGEVVVSRRLRRQDAVRFFRAITNPTLVGIEACSTSHYWGREIIALGHEVRLMPPHYVRPYVKRQKTDAADAAAICEAVSRPSMRFLAVKSAEQQANLLLHRTRKLLVRQKTMLSTAIRSHLAEFGIIAPQGIHRVGKLISDMLSEPNAQVPEQAREALAFLVDELENLQAAIQQLEQRLLDRHRCSDASRRLATIPGVGPITASAITATVPDPSVFRSGRHFAAWLGLTPRQHSTGGKERLGGISKQGDRYLRHLLFLGARNVMRFPKARAAVGEVWIRGLLARRPRKVAAAAIANKLPRIAWAVMVREEAFRRASARATA